MAQKPKAQTLVAVAVAGVYEVPKDATDAFKSGVALAVNTLAADDAVKARFAALDTPEARKEFRAGFVAQFMHSRQCDKVSANSRFDYLAKLHAPAASSRKRKANKRKAGRKEKTGAEVKTVSAKDTALRLTAALAHVAKAQQDFSGNAEMLAWLGAHAAILNGETPEAK